MNTRNSSNLSAFLALSLLHGLIPTHMRSRGRRGLSKQSFVGMVGVLALWAIVLLGAGARAAHAQSIVVHGDSLSAGYGLQTGQEWPALLQQRLRQQGLRHRVVNTSISGETTSGGLARLPKVLAQHKPKIVVLALGGNDGLRGQSLKAMQNNLSQMITLSQKAGAKVVLLGVRIPPNFGTRYTTDFHNSYAIVQRKHKIPLLPFMLEGIATKTTLMQNDGIHPMILNLVWKTLRPVL